MASSVAEFDALGFYQALDTTRKARADMTWRKVAQEAGVSPSTLTRMAQGKRPDVDSLAKLAVWSGLKADDFVRPFEGRHTSGEPLAMISTYLRSDPNLTKESAAALDELIRVAYKQLRRND
jgi:transcriptional regulator with XRE-family HTH domain